MLGEWKVPKCIDIFHLALTYFLKKCVFAVKFISESNATMKANNKMKNGLVNDGWFYD